MLYPGKNQNVDRQLLVKLNLNPRQHQLFKEILANSGSLFRICKLFGVTPEIRKTDGKRITGINKIDRASQHGPSGMIYFYDGVKLEKFLE